MTIQEQIKAYNSTLSTMRKRVEAEGREPYEHEKAKARSILEEIDYLQEQLPDPTLGIKPDPTWINGMPGSGDHNTRRTNQMSTENKFSSDGEFFQAVARASVPNGTMDSRLESRAASGMGISVPSEGGFIVSEDFSQTV